MRLNRSSILFLSIIILLAWQVGQLHAQSSIGIGVSERVVQPSGMFGKFLLYVQYWQHRFERLLSGWLVGMHDHPSEGLKLLAVSFIYGILHAIGPGHGKAVISSYLIANNETLKRGIFLSFFSSLLQAFSAIAIVGAVYLFLPARLTQASDWMTKASFALIMLLGAMLLWRQSRKLWQRHRERKIFEEASASSPMDQLFSGSADQAMENTKDLKQSLDKDAYRHGLSGNGRHCDVCGQSHIFSADIVDHKLDWKQAAIAVISVGIRPCTGAVFIMSFALINGLFWIGSSSVMFMALGTFITVSLLAAFAVKAKQLTDQLEGKMTKRMRILPYIEWLFALAIFLLGLTFFVF
ncbi:nickel/cobalt transporter [Bartonella sp. LJL80]